MKKLYEQIASNGGATVKKGKMVSYKRGYQVAVNSVEKKFEALNEAMDYFKNQKLDSIGLWLDGGVWYMDTNTKRFTTKREALKIAKENKQLAIWDWKKGVSIYA
jgi:uncharacterized protein YecA (UPF0149 family)